MKIFIRADGGNTIGLGHVMRMLVLATELSRTNEVVFICRSSKGENIQTRNDKAAIISFDQDKYKAGIEKLKENEFQVINIQEDKVVEEILKLQEDHKADLLITDSYDVDEEYFNRLKPYFKLTGYVDDVNKCKMNVDFIINQNINAEEMNYKESVNENTKLFLGTQYCMLREEFRTRNVLKQKREKCDNILLTLGGMDNDFNTLKILKQISEIDIGIHVVAGKAFPKKLIKELYDFSKKNNNVRVYENANMSSLMRECDIAISSCGSTLYELCAINVPAIGVIIADNQLKVALKMKEKKLIAEAYWVDQLNNETDCERLKTVLCKLINSKDARAEMIKRQQEVVNINGAKLLSHEINMMG